MEASIINAIIAGVIGLVTGAIGSLVAPWVQWGIEKRRKRYERRVELVKRWRELVLSESFERKMFVRHPCYGSLRPLLQEEVRKNLENLSISAASETPRSPLISFQKALLEEIARIEKSWGLD